MDGYDGELWTLVKGVDDKNCLRLTPVADHLLGITNSAQQAGDMNPGSAPIQTMIKYLHRGH